MKDYSNFINGFITKYEIKDGEILVYTPYKKRFIFFGKKKEEPHRYPATPKNIKYFESRLENQYNLVIENLDGIIKYNRNRKMLLYIATLTVISIMPIMSLLLLGTSLITTTSIATFFLVGFLGKYIINKSDDNFKEEIKSYERYMKNRHKIEELSQKDKNVTQYISEETLSKIEENKKLKQEGKIESVFNIDLMDKIALEELNKILRRYKICESLKEEQNFRIPSENIKEQLSEPQKPKKRTLTPNKKTPVEE